MIARTFSPAARFRLALGAVMVAGGVLAIAVARALGSGGAATPGRDVAIAVPDLAAPASGSTPASSFARHDDPFSPARAPAAERYRIPVPAAPAAAAVRDPGPVVLGTAIATDGRSFATCTIGGAPPRNVRVGDAVGTYVVAAIERRQVSFVAPSGRRVIVRTTDPGK